MARTRNNAELSALVRRYRRAQAAEDWPEVEAATAFDDAAEAEYGDHPLLRAAGAGGDGFLRASANIGREAARQDLPRTAEWVRAAQPAVVAVRWVSDDEAEVYERLGGGAAGEILTRLIHDGSRWRIAESMPAPDTHQRVEIPFEGPLRLAPERFAEDYRSLWDRDGGVSHLDDGRVVLQTPKGPIDGQVLPAQPGIEAWATDDWTRQMVREHTARLELTRILSDDIGQRLDELTAFTCAATCVLQQTGDAVLDPGADAMHGTGDFTQLAGEAVTDLEPLARLWVRVHHRDEIAFTLGMWRFMLPELEMPHAPDPDAAARTLRDTVSYVLANDTLIRPGDTIGPPGAPTFRAAEGRRGPSKGRSYGRWGSVSLVPAAD